MLFALLTSRGFFGYTGDEQLFNKPFFSFVFCTLSLCSFAKCFTLLHPDSFLFHWHYIEFSHLAFSRSRHIQKLNEIYLKIINWLWFSQRQLRGKDYAIRKGNGKVNELCGAKDVKTKRNFNTWIGNHTGETRAFFAWLLIYGVECTKRKRYNRII